MNPIPNIPQIADIARRIIWFEPPEQALADPIRFMAYAMTYARHKDMQVLRDYVTDDDFCEALDRAPPGIIDARSWAYWNSKMGRYPPPPMPVRRFGSGPSSEEADLTAPGKADSRAASAKPTLEDLQRRGRENWLKLRQGRSPIDLEEIQRRARENWLADRPSKKT